MKTNPTDVMDDLLKDLNQYELKDLIKKLAWNKGYGCFTRTGFEEVVWPCIKDQAKWIVYLDIDGMHALNSEHETYDPVNAMIHEVLEITRETDFKAGQLNSGDEVVVVLLEVKGRTAPLDPHGLVGRLVERFAQQGMTATYSVVPVESEDFLTNLIPAIEQVNAIKAKRGFTERRGK